MKKRILYENIWKMFSAHKQMVFVAGPRQAGKTTFTQILAEDFNNSLYFNWDILSRKISRAITKKKKKLYLFDYAGIESQVAKLENNDNQRRLLAVISETSNNEIGEFMLRYRSAPPVYKLAEYLIRRSMLDVRCSMFIF